jgi:hypothetical protein
LGHLKLIFSSSEHALPWHFFFWLRTLSYVGFIKDFLSINYFITKYRSNKIKHISVFNKFGILIVLCVNTVHTFYSTWKNILYDKSLYGLMPL